ncbi:hypothetical protein V2J94_40100 [Streptomyces sp. DSM 41524]|uniref:Uncharacterized protein n=1 Tax=Streptomyces asiaticus subsp. ignotus TaxID=3098222 RepID=A0ABU7Q9P3_9ACTN|nr:hypothetical protein [Streptomyces sp. DSM 41524]
MNNKETAVQTAVDAAKVVAQAVNDYGGDSPQTAGAVDAAIAAVTSRTRAALRSRPRDAVRTTHSKPSWPGSSVLTALRMSHTGH